MAFQRDKRPTKRINENITAREVRVMTEEGESLGILSLRDALDIASERNLDLLEVGMQEGVTLVKLLDYGKHLFKQQKQISQNKSHAKKTDIKIIKMSYKIGDHDLDIKRKQAEGWSKEWHPIKIVLQLRGRENQYEDLALARINAFIESMTPWYQREVGGGKVQKQGKSFTIILYPKK